MIELLNDSHLPKILMLLNDNSLPVNDIDLSRQKFLGFSLEGDLIGVGALEIAGTYALLRSLAVAKTYQNKGFGNKVLKAVIDAARINGIMQIFLLTETAETFFESNHFIKINRNQVPKEIANTEEFKSICPSSAICMTYNL